MPSPKELAYAETKQATLSAAGGVSCRMPGCQHVGWNLNGHLRKIHGLRVMDYLQKFPGAELKRYKPVSLR